MQGWVAEHPQATFHHFAQTRGLSTCNGIWANLDQFPRDQIHKTPHGDYCRTCAMVLRRRQRAPSSGRRGL